MIWMYLNRSSAPNKFHNSHTGTLEPCTVGPCYEPSYGQTADPHLEARCIDLLPHRRQTEIRDRVGRRHLEAVPVGSPGRDIASVRLQPIESSPDIPHQPPSVGRLDPDSLQLGPTKWLHPT